MDKNREKLHNVEVHKYTHIIEQHTETHTHTQRDTQICSNYFFKPAIIFLIMYYNY